MTPIDTLFTDIRNAFRLLDSYQKRVLAIVDYIRCQTLFTDMWGSKSWYSDEIGRKKSPDPDYAKLNVHKDMWGWDFLYGYIFEYYFGYYEKDKKHIEMSVFQVSDDGYFVSRQENKHMTKSLSFEDADKSHTYFVLNVSVGPTKTKETMWLQDPNYPNDDCKDFLTKFFESRSDLKITSNEKGQYCILKKYEMQLFKSQSAIDKVLEDFGAIVKERTGVALFKAHE